MRLTDSMQLLANDMAARKAAGQTISEGALYRMDRYKALHLQVERELDNYTNQYALPFIEAEQQYYGEMGIRGAWDSLMAQTGAGGINLGWNRLPVEAIENMVGLAGDGSPLRALLAKAYPDAMDGIIKQLIQSTALGINPRQTAYNMARGMDMGLDRALTIARTEQLRAFRMASTAQYRESGIVKGFKRLATHDTRTCLACLMSDGEVFDSAEELSDHPNGRCLVPESLVAGPGIRALVSRRYEGDVVTVGLASGQFVTVTPNHPVLTDRGWVAAQFIQEGDNVVCGSFGQGAAPGVGPDEYQVPTLIEQIPCALGMNRLASVPATAKDFHGDGRGSDVYVVWTNGLLGDDGKAASLKPVGKYDLGLGYSAAQPLAALRNSGAMFGRLMGAAHGILGDLDAAMMLLLGRLFGQEPVGFGWVAAGNATEFQVTSYGCAGYTKGFGKGVLRLALQVAKDHGIPGPRRPAAQRGNHLVGGDAPALFERTEQPLSLEYFRDALVRDMVACGYRLNAVVGEIVFDRVIDIGVRSFSGHVYNLQTATEWYNATSSIAHNSRCANMPIVHNCTVIPILAIGPQVQWENGQDWFKGLPEEQQQNMMGEQLFNGWKGHKFGLSDLRKTAHSDTWGDSPRVATFKELELRRTWTTAQRQSFVSRQASKQAATA